MCLPTQGSYLACQNIKDLEVFARAQEVKVDPDKPLEGVRLLALQVIPFPRAGALATDGNAVSRELVNVCSPVLRRCDSCLRRNAPGLFSSRNSPEVSQLFNSQKC